MKTKLYLTLFTLCMFLQSCSLWMKYKDHRQEFHSEKVQILEKRAQEQAFKASIAEKDREMKKRGYERKRLHSESYRVIMKNHTWADVRFLLSKTMYFAVPLTTPYMGVKTIIADTSESFVPEITLQKVDTNATALYYEGDKTILNTTEAQSPYHIWTIRQGSKGEIVKMRRIMVKRDEFSDSSLVLTLRFYGNDNFGKTAPFYLEFYCHNPHTVDRTEQFFYLHALHFPYDHLVTVTFQDENGNLMYVNFDCRKCFQESEEREILPTLELYENVQKTAGAHYQVEPDSPNRPKGR